jgi:hypothetical protein
MFNETPYCEVCGESPATVSADECGLCDDCAQSALRESLSRLMGRCCARVYRDVNDNAYACLQPYGTEHDHC